MKHPAKFTLYRKEHSMLDHLTLWFLTPSIKVREDLDYETLETGVAQFEAEFPTTFSWRTDRSFWTIGIRILGFGLTLTRQKGM